MAFNYTQSRATAASLIEKFGQSVTFSYDSGAVFNPATGAETTPPSTSTVVGNAAFLNYEESDFDDESILRGDAKLILEYVATAPQVGWTVTVNSVVWKVINVSALEPGGTNVIYVVQIRK